jgi:small-conductance mechanosensitive channel
MQDTLGNFFSGLALQIDRPFRIGDWIEVHNGSEKWTGQILEITWRATFLTSFTDELIMIPNRTIAQSQILIFSDPNKSTRFGHSFRFPLDVNIEEAKLALFQGVESVSGVLKNPEPKVLILDTNESYIMLKVIYSLADYSSRYRIGDEVMVAIFKIIQHKGLKLAVPRFAIEKD